MFTSIDKALTAIVMAALYMLNAFGGIDVGLAEESVAAIIAGVTPILVWLIPNRQTA